MQETSFGKRFIKPVLIVLITMVCTGITYFYLSWQIENNTLRTIVAFLSSSIFFISIGFGTFYIYPIAFFRGAGTGERIIACFVTPIVWNLKEMVRVSEFFTFGETLYYGLNTAFLLSVFGALGQMGLCELICRWRLNRGSEETVKVLSPAPVISILVGLAALYVFLLWGLGVHFFYIYIQGYRLLFT